MEQSDRPVPIFLAQLQLPSRCLISTALELPPDISITAWINLWPALQAVQSASAWWIGDYCLYGEASYGEDAEQGFDQIPLGTRRSYTWVSRSIPPSRRREALSWSHHREVARLDPTRADLLLDAAVREQWSVERLREAIREQDGIRAHQRYTDKGAAAKYSEAKIGHLWLTKDHLALCLYLGVDDDTPRAAG